MVLKTTHICNSFFCDAVLIIKHWVGQRGTWLFLNTLPYWSNWGWLFLQASPKVIHDWSSCLVIRNDDALHILLRGDCWSASPFKPLSLKLCNNFCRRFTCCFTICDDISHWRYLRAIWPFICQLLMWLDRFRLDPWRLRSSVSLHHFRSCVLRRCGCLSLRHIFWLELEASLLRISFADMGWWFLKVVLVLLTILLFHFCPLIFRFLCEFPRFVQYLVVRRWPLGCQTIWFQLVTRP